MQRDKHLTGKILRDWIDEPAQGICSSCQRKTWVRDEVGQVCGLTQPSGHKCLGKFRPLK